MTAKGREGVFSPASRVPRSPHYQLRNAFGNSFFNPSTFGRSLMTI